ncbi:MAG: archease [Methanimicrococcus sp.]|nr:archease [Methanimicrococcus sp.]
MSSKAPFIYLDHIADIRFIARGETLETLFENAALATLSVIADVETVTPEIDFEIELETVSLENLIVDFLSELLFLFDSEETMIGKVSVSEIGKYENEDGEEKYVVKAVASGEPINRERQDFKTEVKAVTYSGIRVDKTEDGYETEVVLDL